MVHCELCHEDVPTAELGGHMQAAHPDVELDLANAEVVDAQ